MTRLRDLKQGQRFRLYDDRTRYLVGLEENGRVQVRETRKVGLPSKSHWLSWDQLYTQVTKRDPDDKVILESW